MSTYRNSVVDELANIRTIPATVSGVFVLLSAYMYGGISPVEIVWLDYSIQQAHTVIGSLAVYLLAFMSSETNSFEYYDDWEKGLIIAGPGSMLAWEYMPAFHDLVMALGDPVAQQFLFVVSLASWAVIMR